MPAYSDTFSGTNGSALGTTEIGAATWQVISGTWTRNNGLASTSTSVTSSPPPIAAIDLGVATGVLSATVGSGGGDSLYFRVVDANNWVRLRLGAYQTSSTYSYYNGTYSLSAWTYVGDVCQEEGTPGQIYETSPSYATNPNGQQQEIPEGLDQYAVTSTKCKTDSTAVNGTGYWYTAHHNTRHPNWNYSTGTNYYNNYTLELEKCVAGTITTIESIALGQNANITSLKVSVDGANKITPYANGTAYTAVTDNTNATATLFGIGLGTGSHSGLYGSGLDNFSLDPLIPPYSGWGQMTI